MSASILVAYATRAGSTQEVAEEIAKNLRKSGLEVDVQPAKKVRSLDAYKAVVLGAPLYMFHWHKDALKFLARHQQMIEQRNLAIFALGPMNRDEKEMKECREQLDKELEKFPWLTPLEIELFVGRYAPEKLPFPMSLVTKMPATPLKDLAPSDNRDWDAINSWASRLAQKLM
jgi:menaquinone-dependent protoporphyrinogen oxidase